MISLTSLTSISNVYFGEIEQEAIEEYLHVETPDKRKVALFNNIISPAVKKIASHYAYTIYNLENIEVLKAELYSHAMDTLHVHYVPEKASAYSYLSNVVKNKCIEYMRNYTKETSPQFLHHLKTNEQASNENIGEVTLQQKEYIDSLIKYLNGLKFQKKEYTVLVSCIVKLLNERDMMAIENKKKVILILHEMTNYDIKYIASFLNKIKKNYKQFKGNYYDYNPDNRKSWKYE